MRSRPNKLKKRAKSKLGKTPYSDIENRKKKLNTTKTKVVIPSKTNASPLRDTKFGSSEKRYTDPLG